MHERLDNLYDKAVELQVAVEDAERRIRVSYGQQISGKKIYEFLQNFEILYHKMNDLDKKNFIRTFIEAIELDPEEKDMERIIRRIELAFPVYYEGHEGDRLCLPEENTVETVVSMSKKIKSPTFTST